jgi:hypothetical protein
MVEKEEPVVVEGMVIETLPNNIPSIPSHPPNPSYPSNSVTD